MCSQYCRRYGSIPWADRLIWSCPYIFRNGHGKSLIGHRKVLEVCFQDFVGTLTYVYGIAFPSHCLSDLKSDVRMMINQIWLRMSVNYGYNLMDLSLHLEYQLSQQWHHEDTEVKFLHDRYNLWNVSSSHLLIVNEMFSLSDLFECANYVDVTTANIFCGKLRRKRYLSVLSWMQLEQVCFCFMWSFLKLYFTFWSYLMCIVIRFFMG